MEGTAQCLLKLGSSVFAHLQVFSFRLSLLDFHNACLSQMVLHQRACQIASKTCVCGLFFLAISSHKVIFHVSGYSSVSSVSELCLATQHNDEIKNSAVEGEVRRRSF